MADDGVDDLVGAPPGIGQEFGEHGTQGDQDADSGGGGTEAVAERLEHLLEVLARDDADGQGAEDQRQEGMQVHHGDQDDDHGDTGEEGQDELPPPRRDRVASLGASARMAV